MAVYKLQHVTSWAFCKSKTKIKIKEPSRLVCCLNFKFYFVSVHIFKPARAYVNANHSNQTISCVLSIHFSLKSGSCFSLWLLEDAESKDWNSDCRSPPSPRKKNKMQRKCVCMKAVFPFSSSFFETEIIIIYYTLNNKATKNTNRLQTQKERN